MTCQVFFRGRFVLLTGPRSILDPIRLEERLGESVLSALAELTKKNGAVPETVTLDYAEASR